MQRVSAGGWALCRGIKDGFGPHRPKGLTPWWRIPVLEDGRVPIFQTDVEAVRAEVRSTNPKA